MIKTIVSILISLGLIIGLSVYELYYVNDTFSFFKQALLSLYDKTEAGQATYEDGTAVQLFWERKKRYLHIWLPHTSILEVDYQLYEAVGYLYVHDFESALPKLEVVLGMCENIPQSYRLSIENIF